MSTTTLSLALGMTVMALPMMSVTPGRLALVAPSADRLRFSGTVVDGSAGVKFSASLMMLLAMVTVT